MKYAIVSDVHANPVMLNMALIDARDAGAARFIFLGDVSGYNDDANGAIKLVRENFDVALMGNHDLVCAGLVATEEEESYGSYGRDVAQREEMPEEYRAWMKARPYVHSERDAAFTHGTFVRPEEFDYVLTPEIALMSFDARDERFLFVGHVHESKIWEREPDGRVVEIDIPRTEEDVQTYDFMPKSGCRYIVNVGSIGLPRDGYASYVIWDSDTGQISFHRQRMGY